MARKFKEPFGTGAGPTSSSEPLGPRLPRAAQSDHTHASPNPTRPVRYVLLFGPRGAGVTTLGLTLAHPEVLPQVAFVDRLQDEPVTALVDRVREAEARLTGGQVPSAFESTQHTVIIGGRPFDIDDLQALSSAQIAGPAAIMIRLDAPWLDSGIKREFGNTVGFLEQHIQLLGLNQRYFMVWNGDAARAAASVALRAGYR